MENMVTVGFILTKMRWMWFLYFHVHFFMHLTVSSSLSSLGADPIDIPRFEAADCEVLF